MTQPKRSDLQDILSSRYTDAPEIDGENVPESLVTMLSRGSCRWFQAKPVPVELLNLLSAAALAAPSKSDLQQRDIILLQDPAQRQRLATLVGGQEWVGKAPMLAVFCGNNRRQRLLHEWHDIPFANDHLDAFFNAACDAAIALGAFVTAAEAMGLGCCPISAVRNKAQAVSEMLDLPGHVFPFAGLGFGYPKDTPSISMRLPLSVTCHLDRYREDGLQEAVQGYDAARAKARPFSRQRLVEVYGEKPDYGWSDDKARHYSEEERADFGAYIRAKGFNLD